MTDYFFDLLRIFRHSLHTSSHSLLRSKKSAEYTTNPNSSSKRASILDLTLRCTPPKLRRYRETVLFCLVKTVYSAGRYPETSLPNWLKVLLKMICMPGELVFGSNDAFVAARQRFARLLAWMMLNQTGSHNPNQVQNRILNVD
jgi:hypothetical protein